MLRIRTPYRTRAVWWVVGAIGLVGLLVSLYLTFAQLMVGRSVVP